MGLLSPYKLRLAVKSALHGEQSVIRVDLPSMFIRGCQVNQPTMCCNTRLYLCERDVQKAWIMINGSSEDGKWGQVQARSRKMF